MWIFEHNLVADKAKIHRQAVARQVFFTQDAAKFAEKTLVYACEDRFLFLHSLETVFQICQNVVDVLCADGQTDGRRGDAGVEQFLVVHLGVCGRTGVDDQGLYVCHICQQGEQFQRR